MKDYFWLKKRASIPLAPCTGTAMGVWVSTWCVDLASTMRWTMWQVLYCSPCAGNTGTAMGVWVSTWCVDLASTMRWMMCSVFYGVTSVQEILALLWECGWAPDVWTWPLLCGGRCGKFYTVAHVQEILALLWECGWAPDVWTWPLLWGGRCGVWLPRKCGLRRQAGGGRRENSFIFSWLIPNLLNLSTREYISNEPPNL
jgi:hypothetical protein